MQRRSFLTTSMRAMASLAAIGPLALGCSRAATSAGTGERIVSLGGALTELVYALGSGERLVGVDSSSVWPEAALALPQVGYQRKISAEGVIALAPHLVLHSDAAGPASALARVREAGITLAEFTDPRDVACARARIEVLAARLDRVERGRELIAELDAELARLPAVSDEQRPRVMFLYARGADTLLVAGRSTAAATMIELAGGRNALELDDFRPLSTEAVLAAAPEFLLVTSRGLDSVGGRAGLLALPGIAQTPAGRNARILALDDLALLGFGPRTGATLHELAAALHPEV
jgi:iron complex transport system substrate-binding protein